MAKIKKITPFLWFDTQAEEAANFYVSLFDDSKINHMSRYSNEAAKAGGMPEGSVLVVDFELGGEKFMALNGGPQFKFTGAISFLVTCNTQEDVDYLWEKLSAGGKTDQCGWLTDKYGVYWQIVPAGFMDLMNDPDPEKSRRAMAAMMTMTKLDIGALRKAAEQG